MYSKTLNRSKVDAINKGYILLQEFSAVVPVAPAWKSREKQWYEKVLSSSPLPDEYGPVRCEDLSGS